MTAIWNGEARVVSQFRHAEECRRITLDVPCRQSVAAGQFCHILTGRSSDPLLRRPFTYWNATATRSGTRVELLYAIVGRGTEQLARRKPGARVGYLGPLGNGFTPRRQGIHIFVAGGVGIVPFHFLARQLLARGRRKPRILLLYGGRTARRLYGIDAFPKLGVETHACTEDGSRGRRGLVTDLLAELLPRLDRRRVRLYTCGPDPMNEAVVRLARKETLPCEVSMERRMGCALGACAACVAKVRAKNKEGWRYSRICMEGPCYKAEHLVIE